jgi:trimethylamine:corrinoid methyltransferase-like protein
MNLMMMAMMMSNQTAMMKKPKMMVAEEEAVKVASEYTPMKVLQNLGITINDNNAPDISTNLGTQLSAQASLNRTRISNPGNISKTSLIQLWVDWIIQFHREKQF